MPTYKFKCSACEHAVKMRLSFDKYLEQREDGKAIPCPECDEPLEQLVLGFRSNIERDKEAMMLDIEEEARKIVDRVYSGDEFAIADVYGEKENKLKN